MLNELANIIRDAEGGTPEEVAAKVAWAWAGCRVRFPTMRSVRKYLAVAMCRRGCSLEELVREFPDFTARTLEVWHSAHGTTHGVDCP